MLYGIILTKVDKETLEEKFGKGGVDSKTVKMGSPVAYYSDEKTQIQPGDTVKILFGIFNGDIDEIDHILSGEKKVEVLFRKYGTSLPYEINKVEFVGVRRVKSVPP